MQAFYILVVTSFIYYRIYDPTYLKKLCSIITIATPSQIIPHHISVGKLLNYTVYHT